MKRKLSNSSEEILNVHDMYPWNNYGLSLTKEEAEAINKDICQQCNHIYNEILADCIGTVERKLKSKKEEIIGKYIDILEALDYSKIKDMEEYVVSIAETISANAKPYEIPHNLFNRHKLTFSEKLKRILSLDWDFAGYDTVEKSKLRENLQKHVHKIVVKFKEDLKARISLAYEDMKNHIIEQFTEIDSKILEFLKEQKKLIKDKQLCEGRKKSL